MRYQQPALPCEEIRQVVANEVAVVQDARFDEWMGPGRVVMAAAR